MSQDNPPIGPSTTPSVGPSRTTPPPSVANTLASMLVRVARALRRLALGTTGPGAPRSSRRASRSDRLGHSATRPGGTTGAGVRRAADALVCGTARVRCTGRPVNHEPVSLRFSIPSRECFARTGVRRPNLEFVAPTWELAVPTGSSSPHRTSSSRPRARRPNLESVVLTGELAVPTGSSSPHRTSSSQPRARRPNLELVVGAWSSQNRSDERLALEVSTRLGPAPSVRWPLTLRDWDCGTRVAVRDRAAGLRTRVAV
jgi:hypothetical protein